MIILYVCMYVAAVSVEKVQAKLSEALVNSLNAQIVLHSSGASAPATHFNATERSIFSYIAVRSPLHTYIFSPQLYIPSYIHIYLHTYIHRLCPFVQV